jgi:cytoskeleton protein RodZ
MASFGEGLKRQRELRGIELREISEATKISVRFLQALETDRFDILPGGIFRRSFVKEYARYVGLDPERMVSDFLHAHGEDPAPGEKKNPGAHTPSGGFYRRLFLGVALLAFVGGVAGWSYSRGGSRATAVAEPATPPMVFPADSLVPRPPVAEVAVADDNEPLVLTMTAREDCWVRVEAGGVVLLNEVLVSGRSQTVRAADEFVLSVGNAAALELKINDRPAQALGGRGEVRKNIVINKENLPSLVEEVSPRRAAHSG